MVNTDHRQDEEEARQEAKDEEVEQEQAEEAKASWDEEDLKNWMEELAAEHKRGIRDAIEGEEFDESDIEDDLVDPDEETLPPGEMELIFENSFIM